MQKRNDKMAAKIADFDNFLIENKKLDHFREKKKKLSFSLHSNFCATKFYFNCCTFEILGH